MYEIETLYDLWDFLGTYGIFWGFMRFLGIYEIFGGFMRFFEIYEIFWEFMGFFGFRRFFGNLWDFLDLGDLCVFFIIFLGLFGKLF